MRIAGSIAVALAALIAIGGCSARSDPSAVPRAAPSPTTSEPSREPSIAATDEMQQAPTAGTEGTVVRFSSDSTQIDVTIGAENPTVLDFLSLLPTTIPVEEFAGREKIAYFDRDLVTDGSPGSDPEDGDLIYFSPWGNIGFYYNAEGIHYSDMTVHLGTYDATEAELAGMESGPVTVEILP